jgi:hypothetical protein
VLAEPNPPSGFKVDWDNGKAMVIVVEANKKKEFPDVVVDNLRKQQIRRRVKREMKLPSGRTKHVQTHELETYYDCKLMTVDEFATMVGLKKTAKETLVPRE